MPLNVDRIRQLAAEDDPTIPELSSDQAVAALRLLSTQEDRREAQAS